MAREKIRGHKGDILVESALGEGTTFTLDLPADTDDEVAPVRTTKQEHQSGLRVLVVDDEDRVRTVLGKLLTLKGHEVVDAPSGPAGLEILQNGRFDVIITDRAMPEMDGREFARRAHEMTPHTPIILLTGDTFAGGTDETISTVLAKPCKIDTLTAAIRELVPATV